MLTFIAKKSKIFVRVNSYPRKLFFYFSHRQLKDLIESVLAEVDIKIDGDRPWDLQVRNENLYQRVIARGSLGLGEAYVEGWWDCHQLDELFAKILRSGLHDRIGNKNLASSFVVLKTKLNNLQSSSRSFQVGKQHYDLGNDLYQAMLDTRLTYSCGYWREANNLEFEPMIIS